MAQTEDTELRDLVIESLEKSGALSKIRGLLRANIFSAFEDETNNLKYNVELDKLQSCQEGLLSLSLIYELLEFCNLKNTIFVLKGECNLGKGYVYEGRQKLLQKLGDWKLSETSNEPVMTQIVKMFLKQPPSHLKQSGLEKGDYLQSKEFNNNADVKEDADNYTYIVNNSTENSTSNNSRTDSIEDKNKICLRLPLGASESDSSMDSNREKSEYNVSESLPENVNNTYMNSQNCSSTPFLDNLKEFPPVYNDITFEKYNFNGQNTNIKKITIDGQFNILNSSNSTSYLDIGNQAEKEQNVKRDNPDGSNRSVAEEVNADIDEGVSISINESIQKSIMDSVSESIHQSVPKTDLKQQKDQKQAQEMVESTNKTEEKESSTENIIKSNSSSVKHGSDATSIVSEILQSYEYSNDFNSQLNEEASSKADDSIQEDISLSISEKLKPKTSPGSRSSISISDVGELIDSHSASPARKDKGNSESKSSLKSPDSVISENILSEINGDQIRDMKNVTIRELSMGNSGNEEYFNKLVRRSGSLDLHSD